MNQNDERDLWRDDATRLAQLVEKVLPLVKRLATGKGLSFDPSQMADYAQEAGTALGVHATLKNLLAEPQEAKKAAE